MNKILICFTIIFLCIAKNTFAQNETNTLEYINIYKKYAIEEQLRAGVPASITLAQGIYETGAGTSELATLANNHFGIKCKSNWTGETFLHDDDKKQECFRKYSNALQSYIDHSDFLKGSSRYQFLFELEITDYVAWANGLKRAGYATNPAYVKKLTNLVEKYNLQQYTYEALNNLAKKPGEIVPNNDTKSIDIVDDPNLNYKGLKGFWAKKGDNLQDKANALNIKYNKLLDYNDLQDEPLANDMFIFIEKKKKIGTVEFHLVKEQETMQLISQKEAILLSNLYNFNNMKKGEEPLVDEQLSLQYRAYNTPKLANKIEAVITQNIDETKKEIEKATNEADAKTDEIKTITVQSTNPDIIDVEKAKKLENIMGVPSEVETITKIEVAKKEVASEIKKETEAKKEVVVAKEIEKKVEVKAKAVAPKRTYNEAGVSDSVKMLKQKFDEFVYKPFEKKAKPNVAKPEANKVTEPTKTLTKKTDSIKVEVKNTSTGLTKEVKKTNPENKINTAKQEIKKDSVKAKVTNNNTKNTGIEKTKTGIIRDNKKLESNKTKTETNKEISTGKKLKKDIKKVEDKKTVKKEIAKKVEPTKKKK